MQRMLQQEAVTALRMRRREKGWTPAVLLIAIGDRVQGAVQIKEQALYGWESVCHARRLGHYWPASAAGLVMLTPSQICTRALEFACRELPHESTDMPS